MPIRIAVIFLTFGILTGTIACIPWQKPSEDYRIEAQNAIDEQRWYDAQQILEHAQSQQRLYHATLQQLALSYRMQADQARLKKDYKRTAKFAVLAGNVEPNRSLRERDWLTAIEAGNNAFMQPEELAQWAENAVSAMPNSITARTLAARLWDDAHHTENAIKHYLWLWEADRENTQIGFRLGVLYLSSEQFDDADTVFQLVLNHHPNHIQATLNRARALEAQGKIEQTHQVFTTLLQSSPDSPSIMLRYADFLDRQSMPGQANQWRENAYQLMPTEHRQKMRPLR